MSLPSQSLVLLISGFIRELKNYNNKIPEIPSDIQKVLVNHSKKTICDYFIHKERKFDTSKWISLNEYRWNLLIKTPKEATNIEIINDKHQIISGLGILGNEINFFNGLQAENEKYDHFRTFKVIEHGFIDNYENLIRIIVSIILNKKENKIYYVINDKQYTITPIRKWGNVVKLNILCSYYSDFELV